MFFTQVEGERLLLVATHKRAAALNEISRLKTAGENFYPTSSINFYLPTIFFLWYTVLIFSFGPGGLGADPDRDTSVRGTVSLCSLSLGLKKVHIFYINNCRNYYILQYRIGLSRRKKAFCCSIHT
jgi:hypothetical protein